MVGLSVPIFCRALEKIVSTEPMLRAEITDEIFQKVNTDKEVKVPEIIQEAKDLARRRAECFAILQEHNNRFWDVQFTKIDERTVRVHISVNMLFVDASSLMIIYHKLVAEYNALNIGMDLPTSVNGAWKFLEYCEEIRKVQPKAGSISYWNNRRDLFKEQPQLPVKNHKKAEGIHFERKSSTLNEVYWGEIKK